MLAASVGTGVATALALALRLVGTLAELLAVGILELAALAIATRAKHAPALPAAIPEPRPARPRSGRGIVVVPTYEEREALPRFAERFASTGLDLLIVDDSSPDGTGALAEELAADRPWMHVLHRAGKEGLGVAYRAGFGWCLERDYSVIGQMDCDLSHPPEKLAEMVDALEEGGADVAIASRYVEGGGTAGWSRAREA
ncbi:MAG: glycosyltransferase, partial [Thermoleophilaceae bacterium]|nr:glycosyltransferase [Thermoleophilaceae bacterium]